MDSQERLRAAVGIVQAEADKQYLEFNERMGRCLQRLRMQAEGLKRYEPLVSAAREAIESDPQLWDAFKDTPLCPDVAREVLTVRAMNARRAVTRSASHRRAPQRRASRGCSTRRRQGGVRKAACSTAGGDGDPQPGEPPSAVWFRVLAVAA